MKESISSSERMSARWREHGDRAKRQELDRLRELEELRDLCDNQARIIESMQKQINKQWCSDAFHGGSVMNIFDYISPENEHSIYKGIPMRYRDNIVIRALAFSGCRFKYRGPRRPTYQGQSTCLVEDAITFAVYPK